MSPEVTYITGKWWYHSIFQPSLFIVSTVASHILQLSFICCSSGILPNRCKIFFHCWFIVYVINDWYYQPNFVCLVVVVSVERGTMLHVLAEVREQLAGVGSLPPPSKCPASNSITLVAQLGSSHSAIWMASWVISFLFEKLKIDSFHTVYSDHNFPCSRFSQILRTSPPTQIHKLSFFSLIRKKKTGNNNQKHRTKQTNKQVNK